MQFLIISSAFITAISSLPTLPTTKETSSTYLTSSNKILPRDAGLDITTYTAANCQGNILHKDSVSNGIQVPTSNPAAGIIKSFYLSRALKPGEHLDLSVIPKSMQGSIPGKRSITAATACALYQGSLYAGVGPGCVTAKWPSTCYELWPN